MKKNYSVAIVLNVLEPAFNVRQRLDLRQQREMAQAPLRAAHSATISVVVDDIITDEYRYQLHQKLNQLIDLANSKLSEKHVVHSHEGAA